MIPATGSCRKDVGKSPYPAGKHRKSLEHGSSIPAGNLSKFSGFLPTSFAFLQEPGGKHWKKSEKFTAGIMLRQNYCNYSEPAVFGPDCSTYECVGN
jgi:hypothetical protein